ncbi:MAG: hypothetical protein NVSMB70_04980 [Chamaesiphon sp.]
MLPPEVEHHIGKDRTQRLERTNGILRQQTGRWHRQQNKFGKQWEQTKVTTRLVVSYFNWMWKHSRFGNTAAQGADDEELLRNYPSLTREDLTAAWAYYEQHRPELDREIVALNDDA